MSLLINAPTIAHNRNGSYDTVMASRELLRRQLAYKQHQITCPVRFRDVVEGLGV